MSDEPQAVAVEVASAEVQPIAQLNLTRDEACVILMLSRIGSSAFNDAKDAQFANKMRGLHIITAHAKEYETLRAKLIALADWHDKQLDEKDAAEATAVAETPGA